MKQTRFDCQESFEVAGESRNYFDTPSYSSPVVDGRGKWRARSFWTAMSVFNLLPAAVAAATADPLVLSLGSGVEVVARSLKGGCNVQMAAATDNTNAMLIPAGSTGFAVPLTAVSQPRFSTRVRLTQITLLVFGAGLDENITSPVSSATAGDGAGFYFDPLGEVATGLPAASLPNWILTQKVAGADTYIDSGVPVIIATDYELEVKYGEDLIPKYYINGLLVGTGVAGTSGAVLGFVVGVQANGAQQADFDCRYVATERFIG